MAGVSFCLISVGVPFPVIIVAAALAGYVAGRASPRLLGEAR